ncbi:Putative regulator of ribonuclease activity [Moraxella lacunata]|uniref:4-hydroxy-4-methyl-2-oxoglutarate aldolase n=1 Tax=Moraxella lacunata TaxID=477 RepID=A0A1V4GNZ7_MORLA|nr:ribonuclease E activity regulator RraA [Moraxella lacunata]OPH34352.1 ribonuclease activity regulator protein RraA [Moraxella lacunata]STZ01162.1 Putative regulator of ribonuclease activity [Moraxella lacunata]
MTHFITCDLLDDNEDKTIHVIPPMIDGKSFKHYGGITTFGGQAVTVKCFEDNSRVKELLATDGQGKILVVDGGASLRCALMGDMIAKSAVDNGWAGVIICGCVRDVDEIAKMNLGVLALASIPKKSVRKGVGETGLPIVIGGVVVHDGDWVYADNNGVIVSGERLV